MEPNIALLLGTGFIMFVLHMESKDEAPAPASLWIFTIWFFVIGSRPLMLWIYPSGVVVSDLDYDGTGGSTANTIFFLFCTAVAVMILLRRKISISSIIQNNISLFILLAYCGISCLWSEYPAASLRRWIRMLFEVVVIIVIVSDVNRMETVKRLITRYAYIAIPLSVILIKYFPQFGVQWNSIGSTKMWSGVAVHKNAFGAAMGACCIFFAWKAFVLKDENRKILDLFLVMLCAYMLINPEGKGSTTSLMSTVIALLFLLVMLFFKGKTNTIRVSLFAAIGIYFFLNMVTSLLINKSLLEFVISSAGREMTFTDRTVIWEAIMNIASQNKLAGVGYGAFWTGERYFELYKEIGVTSSHSGFIEVYADIGLIGLVLLLLVIFAALNNTLKNLEQDFYLNTFNVAIISYVIASSFFETVFLQPATFRWVIFLIASLHVPRIELEKNKMTEMSISGHKFGNA